MFDLRLEGSGGNEDNGDLFKRSQAGTVALSVLNPAAGHHPTMLLPETPGHSRTNLDQSLLGSLFLSPGSCAQNVLFVPSKIMFPSPV